MEDIVLYAGPGMFLETILRKEYAVDEQTGDVGSFPSKKDIEQYFALVIKTSIYVPLGGAVALFSDLDLGYSTNPHTATNFKPDSNEVASTVAYPSKISWGVARASLGLALRVSD